MDLSALNESYKSLEKNVGANQLLVQDICEFIKEECHLRKKHQIKTELLLKKYMTRLEKIPTNIHSETLYTTWGTLLNSSLAYITGPYVTANEELDQICETFKSLLKKKEETKNKYNQFYNEMLLNYQNSIGSKNKVFSDYQSTSSNLSKTDSNENKLLNKHSLFINYQKTDLFICIEAFNFHQNYLCHTEIPNLYNEIKDANENHIDALKTTFKTYVNCHLKENTKFHSKLESLQGVIGKIDPQADAILMNKKYLDDGSGTFSLPLMTLDKDIFGKDNLFLQDENIVNYLVNNLSTLEQKTKEFDPQLTTQSNEIIGLTKLQETYYKDSNFNDYFKTYNELIDVKKHFSFLQKNQLVLNSKINKIKQILGEEKLNKINYHWFKASSFITPSTCDHCKTSIWGLKETSGFVCERCGYTCHNRCKIKTPPYCGQVRVVRPKNQKSVSAGPSRSNSLKRNLPASPSSIASVPLDGHGGSSGEFSPSHTYVASYVNKSSTQLSSSYNDLIGYNSKSRDDEQSDSSPNAHLVYKSSSAEATKQVFKTVFALYNYQHREDNEIDLVEDEKLILLQENEQDGWIKVENSKNESGYVPYGYLEINSTSDDNGAQSEPTFVVALYDYEAKASDELSFSKDDRIKLLEKKDDGWWFGLLKGQKGFFPSNYVTSTNE